MLNITLLNAAGDMLCTAAGESRAHILYNGAYEPGMSLAFQAEGRFLWVQVDTAMAPALVYLPEGRFVYRIPQGEARAAYPPQAFSGDTHLIRARHALPEEVSARRNLALNPADQRGDSLAFPHAYANVETRDEAGFAARNAIDGCLENTGHGAWPYQSWGIGAREDAWCQLDFGRPVRVDTAALVLRADFPHDAYWTRAELLLSDGARIAFPLEKTGEKQFIPLGTHTVTWMRLENLVKSDDPSAFPALIEWEVYGAEA